VQIARVLHAAGVDLIDCSSGGVVPDQAPVYGRMFNVKFADLVRNVAGVPAMTVGNVQDVDQANTILAAGRADLVAMARPHLADPYLANRAAAAMGVAPDGWPVQYRAGVPRRR
jgi:anthraniloyl-CoA monooxygenase